MNLYTYCENDPIRYTDPSGHSIIGSIFGLVTKGVSAVAEKVKETAKPAQTTASGSTSTSTVGTTIGSAIGSITGLLVGSAVGNAISMTINSIGSSISTSVEQPKQSPKPKEMEEYFDYGLNDYYLNGQLQVNDSSINLFDYEAIQLSIERGESVLIASNTTKNKPVIYDYPTTFVFENGTSYNNVEKVTRDTTNPNNWILEQKNGNKVTITKDMRNQGYTIITKLPNGSTVSNVSPPINKKEISNITDKGSNDFKEVLNQFPKSYWSYLQALHKKHPEWKFEAYNTGVDFNTFVNAEMKYGLPCSDVPKYQEKPPVWQDGGGFCKATRSATAYFIDPRNFLDEKHVFQFLTGEYDKETQNLESVKKVLVGTNLEQYAQAFLDAGNKYNISSVYLAAKSLLETNGGKSTLARGAVKGYPNCYNYYGINAFDGVNAQKNAAEAAKKNGWNTPYNAIVGGANIINNNYISKGQDTLYYTKWDVSGFKNSSNSKKWYPHQWATNVGDAYAKSEGLSKGLKNADAPFVFKIPVYKNMPDSAVKP